uniref:Uncharacterized protein n=1 Tax=Caenorhabditis japonica TaxID=281687 RepID=A0A8R1EEU2_CAEJA
MSHLTDIPLLGKQYVPGLWRQFEGASAQPVREMESMSQSNVTVSTSTQPKQERKENTRVQITGLCRHIDKRTKSNDDVVTDSAPPTKIARRW